MNPVRIRLDRESGFSRGEGLPLPWSRPCRPAEPWMAARRRHGVSEGQDGRSERPETRQGQSLAVWFLLMLVCFVGHPAAAEDAAAPSAGLAAQERARAIAAELVRGVIDGQLQQLEENGLADRPLHADILALRGTIDSLVQREMKEVIELLGGADAAAPAERREMIGAARTRARAIVTRLAAERQQVVRRLKEATLAAEARSVLERQSRLLKATESLPTLPDGRREQAMLAAIEEERNVKTLLATLQASLADVSNWGGETGATGLAGLRELEKEGVAAAVAAAESRLAAADPAAAAAEQAHAHGLFKTTLEVFSCALEA